MAHWLPVIRQSKPRGGFMKARNFILLAAFAALCGCAAMQTAPADQAVTAQKAVYVVSEGTAPGGVQPALADEAQQQGASKLMRIYWFLGGR